jgi:hypothetical protein
MQIIPVRWLAVLAIATCVAAEAHASSSVLSIHQALTECGGSACGGTVEVRGWLYVKFELAALYESPAAARNHEYARCLGVVLPRSLRLQLERFQKSQVVLAGTLNGFPGGGVCGAAYLIVSKVVSVSSDKDGSGSWPVIDPGRVKVNPDLPQSEALTSLASQLVAAFAARDLARIQQRFAPDLWSDISRQLGQPDSRIAFLLAQRRALFGGALSQLRLQIDFLQSVDRSDTATACVCKRDRCDPTQSTLITWYQSFADPYVCFSAVLEDQQWYIDDPMFVDVMN